MSITPVHPLMSAEISDQEKWTVEQRLASAEVEPRQDAHEAIEEIRRKLQDLPKR